MMTTTYEGHCLCGAVRYRVKGDPVRALACHCTACQRRTGSAFGISAYFREDDVEILSGELQVYEHRSDETGRPLRMEFCRNCGTTVTWTVEALPGARGIAGGTFDDPNWFDIKRHYWTRSAQHWMVYPTGVEISATNTFQD